MENVQIREELLRQVFRSKIRRRMVMRCQMHSLDREILTTASTYFSRNPVTDVRCEMETESERLDLGRLDLRRLSAGVVHANASRALGHTPFQNASFSLTLC